MLATRGAVVAVVDLDEPRREGDRRAHRQEAGGRAAAFRADVSRAAELDRAIDGAVAALGPLEIMVNNAGILDGYFDVDETDEAVWERVIDIDLTGIVPGLQASADEMLPRGGADRQHRLDGRAQRRRRRRRLRRLEAWRGGPDPADGRTYSARGLTVNAVCPGPILTALRPHSQQILGAGVPDWAAWRRGDDAQVRAMVPVGRRGTVEDIAAPCVPGLRGGGLHHRPHPRRRRRLDGRK